MFSGLESPWHLLVVFVIALIVFGPKRLPELGRSLGSGVRGFRASLSGEDEDGSEQEPSGREPASRETTADAAKSDKR